MKNTRRAIFALLGGLSILWMLLTSSMASATPVYRVQELFPLPGDYKVQANAINASGQVVGYSRNANARASAVLWENGTVRNLTPQSAPWDAFVAIDINDVGQIVGSHSTCDFGSGRCEDPTDGADMVTGGFGAWVSIADPNSSIGLPPLTQGCMMDGYALQVSNSGYTWGFGTGTNGSIRSPHGDPSTLTDFVCIHVLELFESGVAVTELGFLFDPIIDALGNRAWAIAPTCDGDGPAYFLDGDFIPRPVLGLPAPKSVKSTICNLAANGYSRDRQQNARGQIISNIGERALLYTPVSEPGTLLLLSAAFAGFGWSRRKLSAAQQ